MSPPLKDDLDVVVTSNGSDLDFLEVWRPFLQHYHLIIVHHGEASKKINVPQGFDYEVFNRDDVNRILGSKASCFSFNDSFVTARCFGYLVSKKKYIYTIDGDCCIAKDSSGTEINALAQHIQNLLTPSTPLFFNTLYDPYRDGADFVRGYPFSMREGVPTAISHGLILDNQLNTRYVDAVLTIPKGALFPMSGMNLAFNRDLIGPAMYSPVIGDQEYDDIWTGLCTKVIADHLGLGVKTGLPYVYSKSSANTKEYKDMPASQDEIVSFFQSVVLPRECITVQKCYIELSKLVKEKLGSGNPYFSKLADAMVTWSEAWEELNQ